MEQNPPSQMSSTPAYGGAFVGESNILDLINEVEEDDDLMEDVEMLDVEEGELVEKQQQEDGINDLREDAAKQCENGRNKRSKKKRRNKKKGKCPGQNFTDVNRFVSDTCRHLKEKKSYMVYSAVGYLGVSALSDLVKEVDAIQSCGGQMTADGRRNRSGGGILWNIMKTREPAAFKEIMKRSKEFEKQFKQPKIKGATEQNKQGILKETNAEVANGSLGEGLRDSVLVSHDQHEQLPNAEGKHKSVHERIRVPVSYDDLIGDDPKEV